MALARRSEETHPNLQIAVALYSRRGFATRLAAAIAAGEGPDSWYHYYAAGIAAQACLDENYSALRQ